MIDKICMRLAWLMPERITYWCTIRIGANATQGQYSNQAVPDLLFMDALKRWEIN